MNETFLVDQKYDFKSHKVSNFISTMFKAVDSSTVCVFFNNPRKYSKRSKSSFDDFSEKHTSCGPLTNNINHINLSKGINNINSKLMVFIGLGIYRILYLKDIRSRIISYINQIRFN